MENLFFFPRPAPRPSLFNDKPNSSEGVFYPAGKG